MKLLNFNVMYTSVFGYINLDRKGQRTTLLSCIKKKISKGSCNSKPQKDVFCVPNLRQHLIGTHTFIANELLISLFANVIFVGYRVSTILLNKCKNFNDNMNLAFGLLHLIRNVLQFSNTYAILFYNRLIGKKRKFI